MRRRRFTKWAKWACTLAAVVCVGVAVFSRFYLMRAYRFGDDDKALWLIDLEGGLLCGARVPGVRPDEVGHQPRFSVQRSARWSWGLTSDGSAIPGSLKWHCGILCNRLNPGWSVGMSVVYPVLLTTIPAALLWYKDRRRLGPHACQKCGYDKSGIAVDTKCPECGTVPARG
jgi:hypothetical protein